MRYPHPSDREPEWESLFFLVLRTVQATQVCVKATELLRAVSCPQWGKPERRNRTERRTDEHLHRHHHHLHLLPPNRCALSHHLHRVHTHTHSRKVKLNLPLRNDAKAAAAVLVGPLKAAGVIHTRECAKLLYRANVQRPQRAGWLSVFQEAKASGIRKGRTRSRRSSLSFKKRISRAVLCSAAQQSVQRCAAGAHSSVHVPPAESSSTITSPGS